jgi:hypothetical protein
VRYLASSKKLPIYNSSSFGFIKGRGAGDAIDRAVELRSLYEWCVKADIEAFFDQVPRSFVKERVSLALPNNSIVPLICDAIGCEIRGSSELQARVLAQGIQGGRGVRQGMPLSPYLQILFFQNSIAPSRRIKFQWFDMLTTFCYFLEVKKRLIAAGALSKSICHE